MIKSSAEVYKENIHWFLHGISDLLNFFSDEYSISSSAARSETLLLIKNCLIIPWFDSIQDDNYKDLTEHSANL